MNGVIASEVLNVEPVAGGGFGVCIFWGLVLRDCMFELVCWRLS